MFCRLMWSGSTGVCDFIVYVVAVVSIIFTSKMLVICVDGGRLVARFRGNYFNGHI